MERCHCGQPLHYRDPELQKMVEEFIKLNGPDLRVTDAKSGRIYLVPRHYVALHGLKTVDLRRLGFPEADDGRSHPAPSH